ncbi:GAF domain-containing protein, partial [Piscinibacter sp.]|uniref:GAF domain-containing protein n=1 Tax=Piscinibacter sp. TaxID=1903157 RepID=UPI002CF6033B
MTTPASSLLDRAASAPAMPSIESAASERVRAYSARAARAGTQPSSQVAAALAQLARLQAGLLSHTSLQAAAIQLVSDLAQEFGCERVSLGLLQGARLRLKALSHGGASEFQGSAARELEAAMDEALDQDAAITIPEADDAIPRIVFAHGPLLARGIVAVATLPLRAHGAPLGAMTLEWRHAPLRMAADLAQLEHQLALLAPTLALLVRSELPLRARLKARVAGAWRHSPARRRVVVLGAAALVL